MTSNYNLLFLSFFRSISISVLTIIAIKTPQKVSKIRAKTYRIVSQLGIDKVIISNAAVPPIIPDLLLQATLIMIHNMVQIGTINKVTQKA